MLPERLAATVAAWLAQLPTITVLCRERRPLYADDIRQEALEALQMVDWFQGCHAYQGGQRGAAGGG